MASIPGAWVKLDTERKDIFVNLCNGSNKKIKEFRDGFYFFDTAKTTNTNNISVKN